MKAPQHPTTNASRQTGDARRWRWITPALVLGVLPVAPSVHADTAGRDLAASCAACHGTNGHSTTEIPGLAGAEAAVIASRLTEFRSGARGATVMHQHARGYTDEEIRTLSDYFSRQTATGR